MEINSLEQLRERGKLEGRDIINFSFMGEKYSYNVFPIEFIWLCLRQVDEDKDILEDLKINIDEFLKKNFLERIFKCIWVDKEHCKRSSEKDLKILYKGVEAIFEEIKRLEKKDKIENRFEFLDFSK